MSFGTDRAKPAQGSDMTEPFLRIDIAGRPHDVAAGTTIGDALAAAYPEEAPLAAILDNHVVSLRTVLETDATITPVRPRDAHGRRILQRSAAHVLISAALEVAPSLSLAVGQSILGGTFFRIVADEPPTLTDLCAGLNARIARWCASGEAFVHQVVAVEKAPVLLTDPGGSKARLLEGWSRPRVPLVGLGPFVDVAFGPYAPSTAALSGMRVVPYEDGVVMLLPGDAPRDEPARDASLYRAYQEVRDWNERVATSTVGDLNRALLEGRAGDVIRVVEALQEKKLASIADDICARRDHVRVVCVAGPSSAGKTTFVRRLSVQLRVNGVEPVIVGLDDYYRDRAHTPRDNDGEYDFEALDALNLELIDEQLAALLAGDEVVLPRFDFEAGAPAPPDPRRALRLRDDQVLLVEGIHSLNPRITARVPEGAKMGIYINALTQLLYDVHNRMSTVDTRLLRRIVRDRRYRGTSAAETLARWPSVRRGEDRHIYPFQGEADVVFNSGLVYETSVLKTFAWRYLLEVPRDHPSRPDAYRLLRSLEVFVPLFPDDVPATSVLREFIGGSGFQY
jgi:uridine kinase